MALFGSITREQRLTQELEEAKRTIAALSNAGHFDSRPDSNDRAKGYAAGLEAAAKWHEKYATKAEHKAKGSGVLSQKMSWHNWSAKAIRVLGKE